MRMTELRRLTRPLYVPGDPVTSEERIKELKRMTLNGKPHEEEQNVIERLQEMVGIDERSRKLGILS